jgi:putative oxygen-independent coproporphyrinogen III oxidase
VAAVAASKTGVSAGDGRVVAQAPPLALYVHLPWCVRKCPYCDFNSHAAPPQLPERDYVAALLADLATAGAELGERRFETVFFGGGTPSLFSAQSIDRVLTAVRASGRLAPGAEVSLEANPGAADEQRFEGYRHAGINRLSVGVQSFDDGHLRRLGRVHDGAAARHAARYAAAHFERFSLDLMYGLPEQTPDEGLADLLEAAATGVGHLSCYQLTLEPNTVFYSAPPPLPEDDQVELIEQAVHGALRASGYERYEVSNWARPGEACRHNLNYWSYGDYLGVGAGAHSKLTVAGRVRREQRTRVPSAYQRRALQGDPVSERRWPDLDERVFEFLLNALRLTDGFLLSEMQARTGAHQSDFEPGLVTGVSRGLLSWQGDRVKATPRGLRFLNAVLREFLPEPRRSASSG